jgi:thermitase
MMVGLMAGGLALTACPVPAVAAAAGAESPVSLVVGLRTGGDVVGRLARKVDVVDSARLTGAVTVDVPAGQVAEAADVLRADPAVAYVEPDYIAHMSAFTPNDPSFSSQWGIAKARVNAAWTTDRGSGGVTVAVVDTGVKALPEFAGRLLPGKDFVHNDSNATDDNGHGTGTAGVIAAAGNNRAGIAGICWTCKILPVKVLDAKGAGTYSAIAEGIRYAADQRADIINLSLGGTDDSQVLRDAVAYAVGRGSLVIAAAGNDGKAVPHFPAAIPEVLAVGGSTPTDTRYSWSNYGVGWVDIAAPGCNSAPGLNGAVGQFCGTSAAAPFAAGVAALLASTSPTPSANAIRAALTLSAAPMAGNWVAADSGRIDAAAALAALPLVRAADHAIPAVSFRSPGTGALVRGIVPIGALASDDVGVARVQLLLDGRVLSTDTAAPFALRWPSAPRTGQVVLTLRAYDWAGNTATVSRRVLADNKPPAIRITAGPASGSRVRNTQHVTAVASDGAGVARMELIVNGKVTQRWAGTQHRFSVPTAKYGKTITVRMRAYDRAGNVGYGKARTWRR